MFDWAATLLEEQRTALRKHALETQKEQRLHAMINLAKGESALRAEPSDFDADPWLLGCENVTINLRTRITIRSVTLGCDSTARGGSHMHKLKFRMSGDDLRPRRTKLEIPGWAGEPERRADGSHEYAWHCVPFSEAARYGIEVFYPYENEFRVSTKNGRLTFEGDFGPPPEPGRNWPPFRNFGDLYYTYQSLLHLKPEPGFAIKVETHPSFYTDATGTAPIAVPALIREWWPMLYFIVFKSPAEGQTHIFRPNDPMAQFTMVPAESDFELEPMSFDEVAERELQSRRIYASRETLGADLHWHSATNTVFDGTYRRIYGAARKSSES